MHIFISYPIHSRSRVNPYIHQLFHFIYSRVNPRVYSATPNSSCAQHAIIAKSEKNCAQFRLLRTVIAVKKMPHYCDILKRNTAMPQCRIMPRNIAATSGTHCGKNCRNKRYSLRNKIHKGN